MIYILQDHITKIKFRCSGRLNVATCGSFHLLKSIEVENIYAEKVKLRRKHGSNVSQANNNRGQCCLFICGVGVERVCRQWYAPAHHISFQYRDKGTV